MNLWNLKSFADGNISKGPSASSVVLPHHGHRHFAERLLNRRGFLEKSGLTLGAIAGSGLLSRASAMPSLMSSASQGRNSTTAATPQPIPGGLQLLGPSGPLFHLFLPAPGVEPSVITDFNGFIGWAAVGGTGTHTPVNEAPQHLVFESDLRFMLGEFIGDDGVNHHGAFAFI
jgi:hypothetical protein